MTDYNKAAIMATETLVRYNVKTSPISPLHILEQMENVIVISFSEMSHVSGVDRSEMIQTFGKNRDAISSVHTEQNGRSTYIVAYNSLLPFGIVQHALAREMAHIVMKHDGSPDNKAEAECFEYHLLYPRPLIHAIQATGMRVTKDLLANLTGLSDQSLLRMRHIPGATVHKGLNCFVRSQFMPFFMNFFDYYQHARPKDGSAVADLGTFMEGYEE